MKKLIPIIAFLLIVSNVYSQYNQEQRDKFNQFNTEFAEAYEKDHEKAIKLLNELVAFYDSVSLEYKSDSTSFYCQTDYLYCYLYNSRKEYDKAAVYVEKLYLRGCDNFDSFLSNDEFSELHKHERVRKIHDAFMAPELSPGAWSLEDGIPVGVFSDNTCSALKEEVKDSEIDAIKNPQFKALAKALYNVSYNRRYRVREYKPYPHPSVAAEKNRTGTYSLLDNATGIVAIPGEEIIVFVGETNGQNIGLCSINFNSDYSPVNYKLKEGANSVICAKGGLLYIMYHTESKEAQPIKVHIASGKVNGMYCVEENTDRKSVV